MLRTLKEGGSYTKRLKNEAAHICDDYGFYIKYRDTINKISQLIWYFDILQNIMIISKYHREMAYERYINNHLIISK